MYDMICCMQCIDMFVVFVFVFLQFINRKVF